MENLFNIFRDLIGIILELGKAFLTFDFFGLFNIVADIITALSLMPLVSSFAAFCTMLINAVFGVVELTSLSVLSMFRLDVGTGNSFFEEVFTEFGAIISVMQILGFVLLFFIYLSNITKIMVSPSVTSETPLKLTISATITGVLISAGPTLVISIEKIFALFYDKCLELFGADNFKFINFFSVLSDMIIDSNMFEADTQLEALITVIFSLILTVIVFGGYFKFLLELAQRYIVTAMLIITSPAAISLACAKSTRNSFNKWLRMVGSQFIVVISQVIFMGAFINAAQSLEDMVDNARYGQEGFTIVLWFLLMYAILYVGRKFDSYLAALGLSTIETGRGLLTTMISDFSAESSLFMMATGHGIIDGALHTIFGGRGSRFSQSKPQSISDRLEHSRTTGAYKISTVNEAVHTMNTSQVHNGGHALGQCVASATKGIPKKVMSQFALNTCSIQNGSIRMSTTPDMYGRQIDVAFVPESIAKKTGLHKAAGRAVTIGKENYIAFPTGDPHLSHKFLIDNPGAKAKISQGFGKEVAPIYKTKGEGKTKTGAFRAFETTQAASNSSTKAKTGESQFATTPAPVGRAQAITEQQRSATEPPTNGSMQIAAEEQRIATNPPADGSVQIVTEQQRFETDPHANGSTQVVTAGQQNATNPPADGSVQVVTEQQRFETEPPANGSVQVVTAGQQIATNPPTDGSVQVVTEQQRFETDPHANGSTQIAAEEQRIAMSHPTGTHAPINTNDVHYANDSTKSVSSKRTDQEASAVTSADEQNYIEANSDIAIQEQRTNSAEQLEGESVSEETTIQIRRTAEHILRKHISEGDISTVYTESAWDSQPCYTTNQEDHTAEASPEQTEFRPETVVSEENHAEPTSAIAIESARALNDNVPTFEADRMHAAATSSVQPQSITVHEWVPKANYEYDPLLNPRQEKAGAAEYWHYAVPMVMVDGNLSGLCADPTVPHTHASRQEWLNQQFPSVSKAGFTAVGEKHGHMVCLQKDNASYIMAPVASYQLSTPGTEARVVTASNGTKYAITLEVAGQNAFIFRNDKAGTFAPEKPRAMKADVLLDAANSIVRGARNKKKNKRK